MLSRAILDSIDRNLFLLNDSMEIQYVNRSSAGTVHKAEEELLRRKCYHIWGNGEQPCSGCPVMRVFQARTPQSGSVHKPDGSVREVRGFPVFGHGHKFVGTLVEFRDITDKVLPGAARESEDFFETVPIGMVRTSPDGKAMEVNPMLARLLGYRSVEEFSASVPDMAQQVYVDYEQHKQMVQEILRKGVLPRFNTQYYHKDGTIIDAEIYGRLVRNADGRAPYVEEFVIATSRLRDSGAGLPEISGNFETFMDFFPGCAYLKNEKSEFVFVNKYMRERFINGPWIGRPTQELFNRELAASFVAEDKKTLSVGFQTRKLCLRDKDNVRYTYQTIKFPILRDGQPPLIGGIDIDITKQFHDETRLRRESEKMKRAIGDCTLKIETLKEELEDRKKQLQQLSEEFEIANNELFDTNKALTVLAKNIDKKKEEFEKKIALTITSRVMPILERLKGDRMFESYPVDLDLLSAYLSNITVNISGNMHLAVSLTPTEMQLAALIRGGLSSREIARKMFISLGTVKTHRRNIRKKLNIQNSQLNLTSYLRSRWD